MARNVLVGSILLFNSETIGREAAMNRQKNPAFLALPRGWAERETRAECGHSQCLPGRWPPQR